MIVIRMKISCLLAWGCNSSLLLPSAFIENVQTSCANSREAGRTNESSSWRPQLTTITVSKKRNWLQQSSLGKNQCTKDELQGMLGADEEGSQGFHQPLPSPCPSPDHLRPSRGAPPRPVRLQLPQVSLEVSLFKRMSYRSSKSWPVSLPKNTETGEYS